MSENQTIINWKDNMSENQTIVTKFILLGLTHNPITVYILFSFFLPIYLMTILINFIIITLVITNFNLHSPMYYFLGNLAFLDLSYSTVTTPRLLTDFLSQQQQTINFASCITQIFFFVFLGSTELILLAVMSYDRYVAICYPLHYGEIMSRQRCLQFTGLFWVLGLLYSLLHTLCLLRLSFCGPHIIPNFFCDLPHLYQLSCTDTHINFLVVFISGTVFGLVFFSMTFFPYIHIFRTVFKIKTKSGKHKAFSTCIPHLAVVCIFYGSIIFIYLVPATSSFLTFNQIVSVIYSVITPLMNPLFYSLRNKDLIAALWRVLKYQKY
ncbi:olfactory receptor 1E16-like [Hyperolius riggenbachi]|uniref:olfactory receptor 1E16-like n=1 Tax=Hyperolius riggenbachi TaxID=752182 RepID=UPI0035A31BA9